MVSSTEILQGLIQQAQLSDLPKTLRADVVEDLLGIQEQAALPPELRESTKVLTRRWQQMEMKAKGSLLGGQMARDLKLRLVFQDLGIPLSEVVAGSMDRWDADHFFRYLRGHVRWPSHLSKREQTLAEIGLKYLEIEASRGQSQRDLDSIQRAWSEVMPLVNRAGLLTQFAESRNLKARVQYFLTGRPA